MNHQNEIRPPQWPLKFLRFFLKKEYLEEIEGDMEELFRENLAQHSLRQARRMYTWEIMKLFRPILIRNLEVLSQLNQYSMFKNYFKVSFRGLLKNPLSASINVFGLAMAIGVCVFGYAFAHYTFSMDQFHEHKNEVYLVTFFADREGAQQQFGQSPTPIAEMLKEDFTHIKKVCRVEDRNVIVKYEDKVFNEWVRYVDPDFLQMLTFPMKWGTASSLQDVNSIILNEEMAIKYFGEENPIGQSLLVKFDQEKSKMFKITGVAADFPDASTISFNFLINFENFHTSEPAYDLHDWEAIVNATFIQVDDPAHIKSIEAGMDKYRKLQNAAVGQDWAVSSFKFEPLATLHENVGNIRNDISQSSQDEYQSVIYLGFISVFMLVLACFNYINIAIVTATKRLKEIGVRKSIGATRRVIIVQFLTENIVITVFALLLGVALGVGFFIKGFEQLWNAFDLGFELSDPVLWLFLLGVLLFTSILSGIYPSLYISRFQVVGILKGSVKFGQKNPLTKIFLGIQLVLACIFITSAVMFTQNSKYLTHRPWGYNQAEALYAVVPDYASYEKLHARMAQQPDVLSISGSSHHLGKGNATTVLHFPDREYEVDHLAVDAKYFETMGLEVSKGRVFNDHDGSDKRSVLINEFMVNNLGWGNPIGQTFRIDSTEYQVIGVVKDFHSYNFGRRMKGAIFSVAEKSAYRYLSMKVSAGAETKSYQALQDGWLELFPETPFDGGHQEDVWGFYFEQIKIHGIVWQVFAFVAVALAGLGLYGLVSINVAGRNREFSIRKVLGASLKNIAGNITRQYVWLFIIALGIGAPVSHFLIGWLIDAAYTYHMPITLSAVTLAVATLITVLLITVSTQIRKVVKENPVNGLKVE
jgi:putative ABC transport system permease protein